MAILNTAAETDVLPEVETKLCPFCSGAVDIDARTCPFCGHEQLVLTPSVLGWVTVAEYVAATSKSEEAVMAAIRSGEMDGELVCGTWMVQYE